VARSSQPRLILVAAASIAVGVADGLIFIGFEWLVNHGDQWIWNDVFHTDTSRWRVIPLALVLSLAFSLVLRALRAPRWLPPQLDLLDAVGPGDGKAPPPPPPTLKKIAVILIIGAASLLAGAALGPEAPLTATAIALGTWAAARGSFGEASSPLALGSLGALLTAFFGSLVPLVIPLLVVYQRTKRVPLVAVLVTVLAGVSSWLTCLAVQGNDSGYGGIPSLGTHFLDYVAAVVLGAVAAGAAALLRELIRLLSVVTHKLELRTPWWLAAALFGAVLGGLYLLGGQTVQFSGSAGTKMLVSGFGGYGPWALAGIAVIKLGATSWSTSAGYRGGLVFPSIFVGVALGLCAAGAIPNLAGTGVTLGCVAGLLVGMTSPAFGVVFLFSLLPAKLILLGLAGTAGAVLGRLVVTPVLVRSAKQPQEDQEDVEDVKEDPGRQRHGLVGPGTAQPVEVDDGVEPEDHERQHGPDEIRARDVHEDQDQ
jgi:H+/Cl- antiporter ClcA